MRFCNIGWIMTDLINTSLIPISVLFFTHGCVDLIQKIIMDESRFSLSQGCSIYRHLIKQNNKFIIGSRLIPFNHKNKVPTLLDNLLHNVGLRSNRVRRNNTVTDI